MMAGGGAPAAVGDDGSGALHDRPQSGSVIGDQHVAGLHARISLASRITRACRADALPDAAPGGEHPEVP